MLQWLTSIWLVYYSHSKCHLELVQSEVESLGYAPIGFFPPLKVPPRQPGGGFLLAPGEVVGRPGRWRPSPHRNLEGGRGHPAEHQLAKPSCVLPWRHVFRDSLTTRWPPEWGRLEEHAIWKLHLWDGENNMWILPMVPQSSA